MLRFDDEKEREFRCRIRKREKQLDLHNTWIWVKLYVILCSELAQDKAREVSELKKKID